MKGIRNRGLGMGNLELGLGNVMGNRGLRMGYLELGLGNERGLKLGLVLGLELRLETDTVVFTTRLNKINKVSYHNSVRNSAVSHLHYLFLLQQK